MTTQEIVSKLWNLCNVLRDDGITYHQYVTELTYILFLKMAKETGTEEQIPEKYRWDELKAKSGVELKKFYKELLSELGDNGTGRIREIYQGAATNIDEPKNLEKIIATIDSLDWYSAREEGLGNLYEGLLEKNANEKKSGAGQYFTPRVLIDVMTELMKPQVGERCNDPACGTFGFMIAAHQYVSEHTDNFFDIEDADLARFEREEAFTGCELVHDTHRLALMNAICDNFLSTIDTEKEELQKIVSLSKYKILDLAIRGKLVPQDPNDEPASVILESIRIEKEELIKQGKIKRDKKKSVIFKGDDNSYYGIHLPDSWNWASLREIALSISDGSHNPPPNNGSGIPLLSAANINDNSILMNEISRWITNEEWKIENQRTNIEVGDVLLTIVGSIGRSAVVQNNNHFALQRSVAVIKPCLINPLYLMHIVQSPQIQKWLTDNSKGTAQKGIYLNALSLMIIPIPPLAEQARIVEHIHIAYKQLDLISNALL